jgi:hypothetical protein
MCAADYASSLMWPSTNVSMKHTSSCPHGARGWAQRTCLDDRRWSPVDLNNCTSILFGDLAEKVHDVFVRHDYSLQLHELQSLQRTLSPSLAVRIIRQLRDVTAKLAYPYHDVYARDVHIATKLIERILQMDIDSARVNAAYPTGLLHVNERRFVHVRQRAARSDVCIRIPQDLAHTVDRIIAPDTGELWQTMNTAYDRRLLHAYPNNMATEHFTPDALMHLLTIINEFGRIIADTHARARLRPFIVVHSNLGMDSVHGDWATGVTVQYCPWTHCNRQMVHKHCPNMTTMYDRR